MRKASQNNEKTNHVQQEPTRRAASNPPNHIQFGQGQMPNITPIQPGMAQGVMGQHGMGNFIGQHMEGQPPAWQPQMQYLQQQVYPGHIPMGNAGYMPNPFIMMQPGVINPSPYPQQLPQGFGTEGSQDVMQFKNPQLGFEQRNYQPNISQNGLQPAALSMTSDQDRLNQLKLEDEILREAENCSKKPGLDDSLADLEKQVYGDQAVLQPTVGQATMFNQQQFAPMTGMNYQTIQTPQGLMTVPIIYPHQFQQHQMMMGFQQPPALQQLNFSREADMNDPHSRSGLAPGQQAALQQSMIHPPQFQQPSSLPTKFNKQVVHQKHSDEPQMYQPESSYDEEERIPIKPMELKKIKTNKDKKERKPRHQSTNESPLPEKSPEPKIITKKKKALKTIRATATESPKTRALSKKPKKAVEKPVEEEQKQIKSKLKAQISDQLKQLSHLQNQVKELQTKRIIKKKPKIKKTDVQLDPLQPEKIEKIIKDSKVQLKAVEKKTKKKKDKETLSTSLPAAAGQSASQPRLKSKAKKPQIRQPSVDLIKSNGSSTQKYVIPDKYLNTEAHMTKDKQGFTHPVTLEVKLRQGSWKNKSRRSHEPDTNSIKNNSGVINNSIDNQQLMYGDQFNSMILNQQYMPYQQFAGGQMGQQQFGQRGAEMFMPVMQQHVMSSQMGQQQMVIHQQQMPQQVPQQVQQQIQQQVPQQIPQEVPQQIQQQVPQQISQQIQQQVPQQISQQIQQQLPQQVPQQMPQQFPQQVPQQISPQMPQQQNETQLMFEQQMVPQDIVPQPIAPQQMPHQHIIPEQTVSQQIVPEQPVHQDAVPKELFHQEIQETTPQIPHIPEQVMHETKHQLEKAGEEQPLEVQNQELTEQVDHYDQRQEVNKNEDDNHEHNYQQQEQEEVKKQQQPDGEEVEQLLQQLEIDNEGEKSEQVEQVQHFEQEKQPEPPQLESYRISSQKPESDQVPSLNSKIQSQREQEPIVVQVQNSGHIEADGNFQEKSERGLDLELFQKQEYDFREPSDQESVEVPKEVENSPPKLTERNNNLQQPTPLNIEQFSSQEILDSDDQDPDSVQHSYGQQDQYGLMEDEEDDFDDQLGDEDIHLDSRPSLPRSEEEEVSQSIEPSVLESDRQQHDFSLGSKPSADDDSKLEHFPVNQINREETPHEVHNNMITQIQEELTDLPKATGTPAVPQPETVAAPKQPTKVPSPELAEENRRNDSLIDSATASQKKQQLLTKKSTKSIQETQEPQQAWSQSQLIVLEVPETIGRQEPFVSPSFENETPNLLTKAEDQVFELVMDNDPVMAHILLEQQEFMMKDCGESTDTDGYDESLFKEEYGSHLFNENYHLKLANEGAGLRMNEESYDGSEVDRYVSYKSMSRKSLEEQDSELEEEEYEGGYEGGDKKKKKKKRRSRSRGSSRGSSSPSKSSARSSRSSKSNKSGNSGKSAKGKRGAAALLEMTDINNDEGVKRLAKEKMTSNFFVFKRMYDGQKHLLNLVKDMHAKKKRYFMICQSSESHYQYLQEKQKEIVIDDKGIIRINDSRKVYFEVFVIILAIYNCFAIPLEICLQPAIMETKEFTILNSVIDFIFLLDIFVQFKTTYYDPLSGDEIFDKKTIRQNYLKGRFTIDILATVPFDTIVYAITLQKSEILSLFSLLKLIRVTRLGRIIERMNVKEDIKLMMKLAQIIFFLIMYIHIIACVWYLIVQTDELWVPPLESIDPNNDLFGSSTTHKYLISVYYSILLLTQNDITPIGLWKIFFCASANTVGAIINANVFGNMALVIQNLNQQNSEFQESIDLANTAMKNMGIDKSLTKDVIAYLQYTQQSQNGQQEFEFFFESISPTLKSQVINFIFKQEAYKCEIFEKKSTIIDFFIRSLELRLLDPEFPLINQGEEGDHMFIVKSGECQVFIKDPIEKKDIYVRSMRNSKFFGEFSLLTKQPRSASVRPKSYAMVGQIGREKFEEMIFMFPEMFQNLKNQYFSYQDKYKKWQKMQMRNIMFMQYLPDKVTDELLIILNNEFFNENEEIFKSGDVPGKVFILASGKIEIYLKVSDGELILDTLEDSGCVMNQINILNKQKLLYSARAKTDVEVLTMSYDDLMKYKEKNYLQSLKNAMEEFHDKYIMRRKLLDKQQQYYFLDYQRTSSKSKKTKLLPRDLRELLKGAINRACLLIKFHIKKDNFLTDLIAELKRMNREEEDVQKDKMKEIVKSVAPIVVSKLKKLVGNRIKQIHSDSTQCNHRIKDIAQIVQLINETAIRNTSTKFNNSMELVRQYSPEEKVIVRKADRGHGQGSKTLRTHVMTLQRPPKNQMVQPRMAAVMEQIDEEQISNPSDHSMTQNKRQK